MSFARAEKRRREREALRLETSLRLGAEDAAAGDQLETELRGLLEPDQHGQVRAICLSFPVGRGRVNPG